MTIESKWRSAQEYELDSWRRTLAHSPSPGREHWLAWKAKYSQYAGGLREAAVVDIGCGPDGLIFHLEARRRVGIDPLILSYRNLTSLPTQTSIVQGCAENLPFSDEAFDFALCINMLDHTIVPGDVLCEISRVLRPGGLAFVQVYTTPVIDKTFIRLGYREPLFEYHPHKISAPELLAHIEEAKMIVEYAWFGKVDRPGFRTFFNVAWRRDGFQVSYFQHWAYWAIRHLDWALAPFLGIRVSPQVEIWARKPWIRRCLPV